MGLAWRPLERGRLRVFLMSDFSKKNYGGDPRIGSLQGDIERGLTSLRSSIDGLGGSSVAYSAVGAVGVVWATSSPTTVEEAIARIAAVVASAHGAIPEL